ncbi:transcription termination/antitermination protein NusA [Caloramator sp. E03]|uniref:transcription termination factor NusA n=1 Tax=Caloramator sp. E03 TaxID=2576307 RepID=UPI0011102644|nr:transcription termination factor NusA [Caloramator sp. E03]QCX32277.1 transcription termination/antitermination protein NusA [Caloramator sp. E03]
MNTIELIEALEELVKEKRIDREIIFTALESALVSAYKKNYGTAQNVKVNVNRDTGEIHVYAQKEVVEEVYDNLLEISLEDARKISLKYNIGDIVDVEVTPKDFGRVAAQTAKQSVIQKIREAEREIIYKEFIEKENDLITGVVQKKEKQNVLVDIGRTETLLAPNEQMPNEEYNHGDILKLYVVEVKKTPKGPNIVISRTHPGLIKRLFELEVPEIFEGIVEIKSIAREAGSRTKIAVHSKDENVDPTGACVGPKGIRVQNIVNELKGEKIDIVKWSKDPSEFIANAISPAKVISVEVNEDEKSAKVIVPDYQLSLAIGKEGQNARLAAKLTGWKIDIKSQSQAQSEMENNMQGDETE